MEKNWCTVQLHCRECNARMMDYTLCQDDDRIVLQGITIKCNRCKRKEIKGIKKTGRKDTGAGSGGSWT